METCSIEVELSAEDLRRLDERARQAGAGRAEYLAGLIRRDLAAPHGEDAPHAGMTFTELLARAAGPSPAEAMSDEELAEFVAAEVKAYRAEKRAGSGRG